MPSVTGASASAGVSSASYCATHWISARPTPCSWNSAISASTELMDLHSEKSAQLSGSMSSRRRLAADDHLRQPDLRRDRRSEGGGEDRRQLGLGPRRVGLDDLVAERLQQRRGVLDGLDRDRVDRRVGHRRERRHRDPQLGRRAPGARRRERLGRRRRPGHVAQLDAGEDVEHLGGLAHAARQDAVLDQEGVPDLGRHRDAPALGLEPDQAAAGRRDPDRAAAVVGVGDRDHPRRDRRRRPARRAARSCATGPTGCASRRSGASRSSAGCPTPAASSCRR